jgi:hypothetical protein
VGVDTKTRKCVSLNSPHSFSYYYYYYSTKTRGLPGENPLVALEIMSVNTPIPNNNSWLRGELYISSTYKIVTIV